MFSLCSAAEAAAPGEALVWVGSLTGLEGEEGRQEEVGDAGVEGWCRGRVYELAERCRACRRLLIAAYAQPPRARPPPPSPTHRAGAW